VSHSLTGSAFNRSCVGAEADGRYDRRQLSPFPPRPIGTAAAVTRRAIALAGFHMVAAEYFLPQRADFKTGGLPSSPTCV